MDIWQQRIVEEIKTYRKGSLAERFTLSSLKRVEHELDKLSRGPKDPSVTQEKKEFQEARLCSLLDEKEALTEDLAIGRQNQATIQEVLNQMPEEDRRILQEMCCAEYGDGTSKRLAMALNMDESGVRRRWHKAMIEYRRIKSGCPIR